MPVQETLDAATDLTAHGYRLGQIIVNRARPELVSAAVLGRAGNADVGLLGQGLVEAGLDAGLAGALAVQVEDYAQRQTVQHEAERDLEEIGLPIVRLPELNPPMDLGNLFDLTHFLDAERWS
jgi:hypothetical protein